MFPPPGFKQLKLIVFQKNADAYIFYRRKVIKFCKC